MSEKVTLVICDGMGLSPEASGNAIANTPTPTLSYLLQNYPSMRLLASGTEVGLDMGEPGNSEVGHLTLGTGQVLPQAFQIINASIKSGAFKTNPTFLTAVTQAKKDPYRTLHIIGLISAGGVHGHLDHIYALLKYAYEQQVGRVAIHAITDGRDSPVQVALEDFAKLKPLLDQFPFGVVASVSGRYYAMDRDNSWDRTDAAYWSMLGRSRLTSRSFIEAIQAAYGRGESDETIQPTVITNATGEAVAPIQGGDVVIFTNYRPDRIRQLSTRIITTKFPLTVVTMTDYFLGKKAENPTIGTNVLNAYPLPKPTGTLAQALAQANKQQLHIAETEKYAHITYFFDGHMEDKHAGEEWLLVPSAKVSSFDQAPLMSAAQITTAYNYTREHHPADFTTINYANMDMVGHTGNYEATLHAVACVDAQLKVLTDYAEQNNEWLLITADHGNAEQLINPMTQAIDKEHTTNPVPFILVHPSKKAPRQMDKQQLALASQVGMLADVAPTILDILGISKPSEMVGSSLLPRLT